MASGKYATAINCIDGRVQRPVAEWIRIRYAVDFVDTVTQPGPEGALTNGSPTIIDAMRQNVGVSVSAHQSRLIAVVAHHDCAGNPVSDEEHKAQVQLACEEVARWGYPAEIIGLWVTEWGQVEEVPSATSGQSQQL